MWHANLLHSLGRADEAIAAGERAVEEFVSRGCSGDSGHPAALVALGLRRLRAGRLAEWEAPLTAGLAAYDLLRAPDRPHHPEWRRVRSRVAYAEALVDAGRPAEAAAPAGEAVAVCRAANRRDSPSVVRELPSALRAQALVDLALGEPHRALAAIREAVALCGREPAEVVIDSHAAALGTLARVLAALAERGAVRAAGRSVALYRELATLSPTRCQHEDLRTDRPVAELLADAEACRAEVLAAVRTGST
jgi:tetratricopeptide (TPR) repeat protein